MTKTIKILDFFRNVVVEAHHHTKFVYLFRCLTDRLKVVSLEQTTQTNFGRVVYFFGLAEVHNKKDLPCGSEGVSRWLKVQ
jgi:hypothetical protein